MIIYSNIYESLPTIRNKLACEMSERTEKYTKKLFNVVQNV